MEKYLEAFVHYASSFLDSSPLEVEAQSIREQTLLLLHSLTESRFFESFPTAKCTLNSNPFSASSWLLCCQSLFEGLGLSFPKELSEMDFNSFDSLLGKSADSFKSSISIVDSIIQLAHEIAVQMKETSLGIANIETLNSIEDSKNSEAWQISFIQQAMNIINVDLFSRCFSLLEAVETNFSLIDGKISTYDVDSMPSWMQSFHANDKDAILTLFSHFLLTMRIALLDLLSRLCYLGLPLPTSLIIKLLKRTHTAKQLDCYSTRLCLALMAALDNHLDDKPFQDLLKCKNPQLRDFLVDENQWKLLVSEMETSFRASWPVPPFRAALMLSWSLFLASAPAYLPIEAEFPHQSSSSNRSRPHFPPSFLPDVGTDFSTLSECWANDAIDQQVFVFLLRDILRQTSIFQLNIFSITPRVEFSNRGQQERYLMDIILKQDNDAYYQSQAFPILQAIGLSLIRTMTPWLRKIKSADEDLLDLYTTSAPQTTDPEFAFEGFMEFLSHCGSSSIPIHCRPKESFLLNMWSSPSLSAFMRWSGQTKHPRFLVSYLYLVGSLIGNEIAALTCYQMLDMGNQPVALSATPGNVNILSWYGLFHGLSQYQLAKDIRTKESTHVGISPEEMDLIEAYLTLLFQLVSHSSQVGQFIIDNLHFNVISLLWSLLLAQARSSLKGIVLMLLSELVKIDTTVSSLLIVQLGTIPLESFIQDFETIEKPAGQFPLTVSLCVFFTSMLGQSSIATTGNYTKDPTITNLCDQILFFMLNHLFPLCQDDTNFVAIDEKWKLLEQMMQILVFFLIDAPLEAYRHPGHLWMDECLQLHSHASYSLAPLLFLLKILAVDADPKSLFSPRLFSSQCLKLLLQLILLMLLKAKQPQSLERWFLGHAQPYLIPLVHMIAVPAYTCDPWIPSLVLAIITFLYESPLFQENDRFCTMILSSPFHFDIQQGFWNCLTCQRSYNECRTTVEQKTISTTQKSFVDFLSICYRDGKGLCPDPRSLCDILCESPLITPMLFGCSLLQLSLGPSSTSNLGHFLLGLLNRQSDEPTLLDWFLSASSGPLPANLHKLFTALLTPLGSCAALKTRPVDIYESIKNFFVHPLMTDRDYLNTTLNTILIHCKEKSTLVDLFPLLETLDSYLSSMSLYVFDILSTSGNGMNGYPDLASFLDMLWKGTSSQPPLLQLLSFLVNIVPDDNVFVSPMTLLTESVVSRFPDIDKWLIRLMQTYPQDSADASSGQWSFLVAQLQFFFVAQSESLKHLGILRSEDDVNRYRGEASVFIQSVLECWLLDAFCRLQWRSLSSWRNLVSMSLQAMAHLDSSYLFLYIDAILDGLLENARFWPMALSVALSQSFSMLVPIDPAKNNQSLKDHGPRLFLKAATVIASDDIDAHARLGLYPGLIALLEASTLKSIELSSAFVDRITKDALMTDDSQLATFSMMLLECLDDHLQSTFAPYIQSFLIDLHSNPILFAPKLSLLYHYSIEAVPLLAALRRCLVTLSKETRMTAIQHLILVLLKASTTQKHCRMIADFLFQQGREIIEEGLQQCPDSILALLGNLFECNHGEADDFVIQAVTRYALSLQSSTVFWQHLDIHRSSFYNLLTILSYCPIDISLSGYDGPAASQLTLGLLLFYLKKLLEAVEIHPEFLNDSWRCCLSEHLWVLIMSKLEKKVEATESLRLLTQRLKSIVPSNAVLMHAFIHHVFPQEKQLK